VNTQAQPVASAGDTVVSVAVEEAEAALVEHYSRLVRLAYLTLPAALGKHRRVIVAHGLVQRALPRKSRSAQGGAYAMLRVEVLRAALAHARSSGGRGGGRGLRRAWPGSALLDSVRLPAVAGLRVHPRAGGSDELALDRVLSALPPAARAAFALQALEGLGEHGTRAVLEAAGVGDGRAALRAAAAVNGRPHLLGAGEFDPCTVQTGPTDLLRRRQRTRVGLVAAAVVGVGALLLAVDAAGDPSPDPLAAAGSPASGAAGALDPASLVRVPADAWQSTARIDFTAWPARGDRTGDTGLLRRALAAWAHPGAGVDVTATPGTPRSGPAGPAQLLFAGDVDGFAVVVLHDGTRLVRYAATRHGGGRAGLDFARVDDADITTAAAVVLDRVDGNTRFLTAPWVAEAQTRDLLAPGRAGVPLHRSAAGVTDPVATPGARAAGASGAGRGTGGSCGTTWPVLQLRSSSRVAEHHAFLLTDLGDLTPVHLSYSPAPDGVTPAGPPREATGPAALASWAHSACGLGDLRGQGVRSVNDWEFARTPLPESAGVASWTCDRADTWRGPGEAAVAFLAPGAGAAAPASVIGRQQDGSACSRYGPHVMAGVMWRSPAGHWYLLAAGSRDVTGITATHGVTASSSGPYLSAPAPRPFRPTLTARLSTGRTLSPLGED
jgi:DNA-directed RNA polymerase specialized sigma24 family protein